MDQEHVSHLKKRHCALAAMALAVILALAGCSASESNDGAASGNGPAATEQADSNGTHVVTDAYGTDVEIPNTVNSIVVPFPAATQTVLGLGGADKLTGGFILPTDMNKAMFGDYMDKIIQMTPKSVNAEAVLSCNPDFMIYPSSRENIDDDIKATNVPTLCYKANTLEDMKNDTTMIGEALGGDAIDKAKQYSEFCDKLSNDVSAITRDIPDADKPVVYVSVRSDCVTTHGKDTLVDSWIGISGGKNAATEMGIESMDQSTTTEQIQKVDPDIVICTTREAYDTFKSDSQYAGLKAVQNDKVYLNPLGGSVWFKAHFEAPLQMAWAPTVIQPDACKSLDTRSYVNEFYKTFYDHDVTDADFQIMMNPSKGSE